MLEKKYRLQFSQEEYDLMISSLIEMKNQLHRAGRYTDGVDDVLIKVLNTKMKKVKVK